VKNRWKASLVFLFFHISSMAMTQPSGVARRGGPPRATRFEVKIFLDNSVHSFWSGSFRLLRAAHNLATPLVNQRRAEAPLLAGHHKKSCKFNIYAHFVFDTVSSSLIRVVSWYIFCKELHLSKRDLIVNVAFQYLVKSCTVYTVYPLPPIWLYRLPCTPFPQFDCK